MVGYVHTKFIKMYNKILLIQTSSISFLAAFDDIPFDISTTKTTTKLCLGDLYPSNDASRIFTVIFGLIGIILLGVFIGIFGQRAFEQLEQGSKSQW